MPSLFLSSACRMKSAPEMGGYFFLGSLDYVTTSLHAGLKMAIEYRGPVCLPLLGVARGERST